MKKKLFILLLILVFFTILGLIFRSLSFSSFNNYNPPIEFSCGVRCFYLICRKLGVKINLRELINLFRKYRKISMYDLYKLSKGKGLYATGMKMGLNDLTKLKTPAIVYLWNDHFVVVESTKNGNLQIIDPPNKPQIIPKDKFKSLYSGFVLVISKNKPLFPTTSIEGPDIRFDEYTYNFGEVEQDKKVLFKFNFRNEGKEKLIVYRVRSSCGCIVSNLEKKEFLPGERGTITGIFNTLGRQGWQQEKIYFHTNDPITPLIPLRIQGFINPGIFVVPETLLFGNIKRGESKTKEIYLVNLTKKSVKITNIESSLPIVTWKISRSTNKNRPGYKLKFSLLPNTQFDKFEGYIVISTNNKKYSKFILPVIGKVENDVEVYPAMLFFFGEKGKIKEQRVTITKNNSSLEIIRVKSTSPFINSKILKKNNREYTLIATVNKKFLTENLIKEEIDVFTNNRNNSIIKIPVYGIITESGTILKRGGEKDEKEKNNSGCS